MFCASLHFLVSYAILLMHHVCVFMPVVAAGIGGSTEPTFYHGTVHVQCSQACQINFLQTVKTVLDKLLDTTL